MEAYYEDTLATLYLGDVREVLAQMEPESVHCVVTSPPYWALRDYGIGPVVWGGHPECDHQWAEQTLEVRCGIGGNWQQAENGPGLRSGKPQTRFRGDTKEAVRCETRPVSRAFCSLCGAWRGCLGLEPTPELYVEHIVEVFRAVRRVLRRDGVCFVNLGDSYWGGKGQNGSSKARRTAEERGYQQSGGTVLMDTRPSDGRHPMLKPKDLCGMPWRVAFALQADGWWLRSDIVWHKPNPMPESVTDRPTRAHEYVFLLTKSARYSYDADAVREEHCESTFERMKYDRSSTKTNKGEPTGKDRDDNGMIFANGLNALPYTINPNGRNMRSVWTIPTQPTPYAHFATFPSALVDPCIKAGSSEWGCCPKCGAPWLRVVETQQRKLGSGSWGTRGAMDANHQGEDGRLMKPRTSKVSTTLGWHPSCSCDAGERVACTVLDPFVGSGTTVERAKALGRRGIGVDCKAEYLDMAVEHRLKGQEVLDFAEAARGKESK